MSGQLRNFALWVIIVLLLLALFTLFQNPAQRSAAQEITYSQFNNEVENGRVRDVTIQGPEIHGNFTDGRAFQTYSPNDPTLLQRLFSRGVAVTARPAQSDIPWFVSLLVSWLPFLALIGVWIYLANHMKQASGTANHSASELAALKRQIDDLKREIERLKEGKAP
jgi:cell division protease FtsH